jgi:hypothetical protein
MRWREGKRAAVNSDQDESGYQPGGSSRDESGHRAGVNPGQDESGYRPNVNQVRDEPIPASHDEDLTQEAVVRNEQYSGGPSDTRPDGEVDTRK